jgi:benzoate membrane transport protein
MPDLTAQRIREFPKHLSIASFSSGLIAWLFAVTGPLLIVLQSAEQGDLSSKDTTSWVFAIYAIPGLITLYHAFKFRQPIVYAFSIPGAVLVGASLANHAIPDVIGAYVVTGVLTFLLGIFGVVKKVMRFLPMPVMMGMVSGVLLPFGIGLFHAILKNPLINGIPFAVFLCISFVPGLAKKLPPILGAMAATAILLALTGSIQSSGFSFSIAVPQFYAPTWNWAAMGELVLPLMVTIIAIQNPQAIAVLKNAGYEPPINPLTSWSGIGSIASAFMGGHSASAAGPMTALMSGPEAGPQKHRYTAAVTVGILFLAFGFMAPFAAAIPTIIPLSTIQMLGGLAMISVLTDSLHMSFSTHFRKSALFSFLITLSGISILHIGAPFWGLVVGTCTSYLLERNDFKIKDKSESSL